MFFLFADHEWLFVGQKIDGEIVNLENEIVFVVPAQVQTNELVLSIDVCLYFCNDDKKCQMKGISFKQPLEFSSTCEEIISTVDLPFNF